MVRLSRTIRFCINPAAGHADGAAQNGFGGKPPMEGLGRYYEITIDAVGDPDPQTGYLVNIKVLDQVVRNGLIPRIEGACRTHPEQNPVELMPDLLAAAESELREARTQGLTFRLTPYHSIQMTPSNPTTVLIRQQFDFAAAHRLHVPGLSAEENRAIFGHCNNPAGHGHNYRFEPCVAVSLATGKPDFTLGTLERLAHEVILARFDHKHLNHDTEEFGPSGVIPSVENIAKVFFDLMAPAVRDSSSGKAHLHTMTVWETDRTSCTYPADHPPTNQ